MEVPLFNLDFGEEEETAVLSVLRSKWISMGPKTKEFEKLFAKAHGVKHGVALSNCTVALHLALQILGVQSGDEVIIPSLSFVATASSVCHAGGIPVFADIKSMNDWTIDPKDVELKITSRTKVIVAMHYGGYGADMESICDIAKKYGLYVLEDACHAPLGERQGKKLGSFGDVACYSFYSNKNLSTGEGGMLITNKDEIAEKARVLRTHGMTATAFDRISGKDFYDIVDVGYNYRIDDIRSAIGIVQLGKLKNATNKREEIANHYRKSLANCKQLKIPFTDYPGKASNHLFVVFMENANTEEFKSYLKDEGITTSCHYPAIHLFKCFESYRTTLPITEKIVQGQISLPIYSGISFDKVDYVCEKIRNFLSSD